MLLGTPPSGDSVPLLIISDQGTWELLAFFADPTKDGRELLIREPGLACWVFLTASPECVRTLERGEQWLKSAGLRAWTDKNSPPPSELTDAHKVAVVDRLTRCTTAARQCIANRDDPHSQWNALLYWLVEGVVVDATDSPQASFPSWLTEWASQNRQEELSPDVESLERWRSETWLPNQAAQPVLAALSHAAAVAADFVNQLEIEKLASLRQLAYGASHEVNNPLANISTRAQTLLTDETDPDRSRALTVIYEQAMRAHEMIANMMVYAHPPQPHPELVDLCEISPVIIAELTPLAERQKVTFTEHRPSEPQLANVDRVQFSMLLKALVQNAIEASPIGGIVTISHNVVDSQWQQVSVSDNGSGIPPDVRRHIFDPFFSGREAGRGLGFGLSTARRLIEQMGGSIEVQASDAGSQFTVSIPKAE